MNRRNEAFYGHLDGIREDLNSYIEQNTPKLVEKFLDYRKLVDEEDEIEPVHPPKIAEFLTPKKSHLDIDRILEKKEETFSEMLLRMIDEKGLKDSDVYKSANIDRRLFSKIRGDKDYVPSKKTAISFCLALQLELEETNKLLTAAGYTLSAASRFDLIIMYLIENKEYDIHFANIVLNDYGQGTLSR